MSCLDITTCQRDHIFNNINCNFTFGHIQYICNPTNTCKRTDALYDCCSSNIADCVIERFVLIPTITPTLSPDIYHSCENTCNLTPSTNKCYWYERQNLDISCISKDNTFCCSDKRANCCQTNIQYAYIIFGSVFFLLTSCLYYKYYILFRYTRVIPDTTTPSLSSQKSNNVQHTPTSYA